MTASLIAARRRAPILRPLAACLLAACPLPAMAAASLAQHAGALASTIAAAATATVDNCNDTGPGSLRNAIEIADDPAIIDMTTLGCSTITLKTGAIITTIGNLTLNGPTDHALTISGYNVDRVFNQTGAGLLTLDHLNITDGAYVGFSVAAGGCIATLGNLTMQNSTVSNCAASVVSIATTAIAEGGGVRVAGSLILDDSVISGNQVSSSGGIAYGAGALAVGTLTAKRSTIRDNVAFGGTNSVGGGLWVNGNAQTYATTISGNQAQYAAGVYAHDTATVQNSTVSGNSASAGAGGMKVNGILTLDNSTVAFNTQARAGYGAGLVLVNGGIANSSIIARNKPAPGGHYYDLLCTTGKTLTGNNNLLNGADCIIPGIIIFGDPLLGPLANNGGPTKTHALGVGSAAIDKGSNPQGFGRDQRLAGHERVFGAAADIGAFELTPIDRIFADGFN